jgi:hypothetical protein
MALATSLRGIDLRVVSCPCCLLFALFADLEETLVNFGYCDRYTRTYVPRAMCEVLITNRTPRLEDPHR